MFYECLIYDDRTNINERINKCAVSYCPNVPWILTKKRFQESQKTKVNKKIKRKLNRIGHKVYHFMTYSQERIIKLCDDDCMTNHLDCLAKRCGESKSAAGNKKWAGGSFKK